VRVRWFKPKPSQKAAKTPSAELERRGEFDAVKKQMIEAHGKTWKVATLVLLNSKLKSQV
jgi:hypothetical protein